MNSLSYSFKSRMQVYDGKAPWHFVNIDKQTSKEIRTNHANIIKRFGSIPVNATIGKSTWKTSIFRDNSSDKYLLFVKKEIRQNENIQKGDMVKAKIEIKM